MIESKSLFDTFMPHGVCYQWRPDILWLNVLSDITIGISYLVISIVLLYYMRKKTNAPFKLIVYMFSIFIAACGVTHIFSVFTVWGGQYGVQGLLKAFTAASSVGTVVMLLPLMPKMVTLKTGKEMELANRLLRQQIEQREKAEQQRIGLQNELARVGRVTTVGRMATGLAHELNQPLMAISASTHTAIRAAKSNPIKDALLFECLDDVQRDTQRAGEIIRTLRDFVSSKSPVKSTVDINNLIIDSVRLVNPDARNSRVEISVKPGVIPSVNANGVQIAQVLVNLLRNAVEAIAGSDNKAGKRKIVVASTLNNDHVTVTIEDTGPGVSDSRDLFVLFGSDKPHGMGIGLSISREIIEAHGGQLRYASNGESGTTFSLDLPTSVYGQ